MVFIQPNSPHSYSPLQQKMVNIIHIFHFCGFYFQVGLASIPQWLEVLLGEKFFNPCFVHETDKKSEKNIFCLDCCISLCPQCHPAHPSHRLLQIRRYVYQDVVRLNDAQKLMDCSSVQAYITNNAKVVFLNQRPMTRQFRGSGNTCTVCDRNLQHPFLFCSISCKANQMGSNKVELNVVKVENCLELENGQMTPDSVLELPVLTRTSSSESSSSSAGVPNLTSRTTPLACAATTEFVKRKRSSVFVSRNRCRPTRCTAAAELTDATSRRRKGVPHRSPLY
ncbi:hypothetical protein RHGRI_020141 [Rhododendron griersonianum]|uniref:B box-type domain-containing protein n=1 Tax=Rhododendron griersonianum TaxID=479676 RepID=A0AAV6JK68_9ERIC|nr:hypothetical protein RHGRI_020141 [Rhododendron griersonianum]